MTPVEAITTLETAFAAGWGSTTPIAWENTAPILTANEWVRFSIVHNEADLRAWTGSSQIFDRPGVIFIQVFVALGTGKRRATELAYQALSILEGKQFGILQQYGTIDVMTGTVVEIGNTDASYYQMQARIRFRYDEVRVT